jgi:hypothetical protein
MYCWTELRLRISAYHVYTAYTYSVYGVCNERCIVTVSIPYKIIHTRRIYTTCMHILPPVDVVTLPFRNSKKYVPQTQKNKSNV